MAEGDQVTVVKGQLEVPGDVMVEGTIMVVSYIAPDGTQRYGWQTRGEFSVATGIGLLEIVKQHMLLEVM